MTLSLYACGSYQRILGRSIDVSVCQATVSRCIKEITLALNHPDVLTRCIKFPVTPEERAVVIRRLVFICYAALNIINVDARLPGSVTDNLIWQASPARQVVEQAYWNDRCWLLGDNGYFTAPWLHVPVINASPGTPEFIYTQVHCRARNVVERCIGVLKSRWRLLCSDRCINYKDAAYAGQMINACCVLHNFCNGNRVDPPAPLIENNVDHGAEVEPPPEMPFDVYRLGQQEQQF
ncbi:putative nuclease HARBI1 [Frankliniella occidentalis]|uniref:Nuclease HARBI1 n=1 Tax=Frankliniella occidentalis TaxID=133901 RepID=A0A9C6X869_FRAOC|nr:putative nuclease HARBI1 [Frankliniella occidentalis]